MTNKKLCKCAAASITYADDWKNMHGLMLKGECWAGSNIAERLKQSLIDMKKDCNIDINQSSIDDAEYIVGMFKRKEPADKLVWKEKSLLDGLLNEIESDVITKIQRECR
jgi:hypothetical protein